MPDHRIVRAKERYGVDLTCKDLDAIMELIQAGKAYRAVAQRYGESWIVTYKNVPMIAQLRTSTITPPVLVTFLPADTFTAGAARKRMKEGWGKGGRLGGRVRENELRRRRQDRAALA